LIYFDKEKCGGKRKSSGSRVYRNNPEIFNSIMEHCLIFRISRSAQKVSYSPRKERALKIYTEDNQPHSSAADKKTVVNSTTTSPDLD